MNKDYQTHLDWIASQHGTLVESVIDLANINSGSLNLTGLSSMEKTLKQWFAGLDCESESIKLSDLESIDETGQKFNQAVGRALSFHKHQSAPLQILLMGHMDTVYGVEHAFQECRWLDEQTLNGPGVADLKGGLVIMLTALKALERSQWAGRIGWQVLINSDEEIGSLSSSPLMIEAAQRNHLGLIFEPSLPDGTLAGARKGSGNFTLIAKGRAAHAGREHHLGRNAIRALAQFTLALDDLNGKIDGITVNPGYVHGGGPVNIVPDTAILKFNVRITQSEHKHWFETQLDQIINQINKLEGIELEVHGRFGRMPKTLNQQTLSVFDLVRQSGLELGIEINWKDTGGCCDGNNLAAAGLPNVDTLGAVGGSIHSSDEYIKVNSLVERSQLTALILMQLASGEQQWPHLGH